MGGIIGGRQISTQDKAILDLKIQRDKLQKYRNKIQIILNRETESARFHLANNDKQRALLILRRKKYQTDLMAQTETQLMNLEQLCNSIEFALVEKKVLEGLKSGNIVLKRLNDEMRIEDVDKLMEETADAIAYRMVCLFVFVVIDCL